MGTPVIGTGTRRVSRRDLGVERILLRAFGMAGSDGGWNWAVIVSALDTPVLILIRRARKKVRTAARGIPVCGKRRAVRLFTQKNRHHVILVKRAGPLAFIDGSDAIRTGIFIGRLFPPQSRFARHAVVQQGGMINRPVQRGTDGRPQIIEFLFLPGSIGIVPLLIGTLPEQTQVHIRDRAFQGLRFLVVQALITPCGHAHSPEEQAKLKTGTACPMMSQDGSWIEVHHGALIPLSCFRNAFRAPPWAS